jgi:hypothetical protein
MEFGWTDGVKNEVALHKIMAGRNILHTIKKRRKVNWIDHILRRNCLLKRVIEGKIGGRVQVVGRRERRLKQLPDDLHETRGEEKLKMETLDALCGELTLKMARDLSSMISGQLSPQLVASSDCGWRNGLQYGG